MTREEFIKVLDRKKYSYKIQGDNIIVTHKGSVWLNSLTSLPPGVEFENGGGVYLDALTSLPPGVEFKNWSGVNLNSLTSLPPGVEFKNGRYVLLNSIIGVGGYFHYWEGNIEGIDEKRLLNKMISIGIFER